MIITSITRKFSIRKLVNPLKTQKQTINYEKILSNEDTIKNARSLYLSAFQTGNTALENYSKQGMTFKPLYNHINQCQILVIGCERGSSQHYQNILEILNKLSADNIVVDMPCDLPIFIVSKKENNFLKEWEAMISSTGAAKYQINPSPQFSYDILLNSQRSYYVIKNIADSNKFGVKTSIVKSKFPYIQGSGLYPDCFFAPIVYSSGKVDAPIKLYIGGYPTLAMKYNLAIDNQISDFMSVKGIIPENSPGSRLMTQMNYSYMAEVMKQASENEKRLIVVSHKNKMDAIEAEWNKLSKEPVSLQSIYKYSSNRMGSMMELVQKLVVIDKSTDDVLSDYYIRYKCLPYDMSPHKEWKLLSLSFLQLWESFVQAPISMSK